jgi:hypothetical protein
VGEVAGREGVLVYPATGGINETIIVAPPLMTTRGQIRGKVHGLDAALGTVEQVPHAKVGGRARNGSAFWRAVRADLPGSRLLLTWAPFSAAGEVDGRSSRFDHGTVGRNYERNGGTAEQGKSVGFRQVEADPPARAGGLSEGSDE